MEGDRMSGNKYFEALVLSGGGFKGFLQLGVLHYLYENGLELDTITEFSGTSIGSIICLLLIVGYKPLEIFKKILKVKFEDFVRLQSFEEIYKNKSLLSIEGAFEFLDDMIIEKMERIPTLLELFKQTGKTLYSCCAIVNSGSLEFISYKNNPHMLCTKAVRLSSNIPFIFKKIKNDGKIYADGGLLNNIPYEPVKNCKMLIIVTLGVDTNTKSDHFSGYLSRIITMPINALTEVRMRSIPSDATVFKIKKDGVTPNLYVTEKEKTALFMWGYNFAKRKQETIYLNIPEYERYIIIDYN